MSNLQNLKINLTKAHTPVFWFDTWFIWSKSTDIKFWQQIAKLVLENRIIVVDTGQLTEMVESYSNSSVLPDKRSISTMNIYKEIVGKYFTIDHSSFQARQIKIAMYSYVNSESEVKYSFSDLFDDLIRGLTPILNEQNKYFRRKWGTPKAFKGLSSDIVQDWENIRQEARSKKQTLKERREQELLGMYDVLLRVSKSADEVKKRNLVYSYLRKWKRISGNNNFEEMLEFFKSDYFKVIPYESIHSWLISDLIVGNETPRPSDYFDTVMASMILPYADFMVVDGPMRNRIIDTLKLVKPKGLYDCKIIRPNDVEAILVSIDKSIVA